MTTIVYVPKEQLVVSDSQETGSVKSSCKKLYRVRQHVIATAGNSYSGLAFVEWFEAGADLENKPDLTALSEDEDFECMVVRPGGSFYTVNRLFVPYNQSHRVRYSTLGSGGPAAAGAILAGANAREAVRIAMRIDPYTGGKLQVMHVK